MKLTRGHRRRHFRVALGFFVLLVVASSAVLFMFPSTDRPRQSDAIVVLGGSGPRTQKGLALARAGYAPYLVVSINAGAYRTQCPRGSSGVTVICFTPDPLTTQGEARAIAKLAQEKAWHQVIVVPSTPETTRARIRFKRCFHGTLLFDPASPGGLGAWVYNVIYEWGALAKALTIQPGC
jgi:uncharacterized SAM-binding protein YcdF (DUF218 family)